MSTVERVVDSGNRLIESASVTDRIFGNYSVKPNIKIFGCGLAAGCQVLLRCASVRII